MCSRALSLIIFTNTIICICLAQLQKMLNELRKY